MKKPKVRKTPLGWALEYEGGVIFNPSWKMSLEAALSESMAAILARSL